jgi:hypothetical protein
VSRDSCEEFPNFWEDSLAACKPRKGHFGSIEAKGQGSPPQKYLILNEIKELQKYLPQNPGNSRFLWLAHVKLPAHRAGLPGNEISFLIVPLDPAYKAGLAGHLPAMAGRTDG